MIAVAPPQLNEKTSPAAGFHQSRPGHQMALRCTSAEPQPAQTFVQTTPSNECSCVEPTRCCNTIIGWPQQSQGQSPMSTLLPSCALVNVLPMKDCDCLNLFHSFRRTAQAQAQEHQHSHHRVDAGCDESTRKNARQSIQKIKWNKRRAFSNVEKIKAGDQRPSQ